MSAYYFGPLGGMKPLKVSAGVPVDTERRGSEFITSGGVRHAQQGRAAPRTWQLARQWQPAGWAKLLTAAAHGLIPECWLYDVATAHENMISSSQATGPGPTVMVDGLPLGSVLPEHQVTLPVLAGRMYAVSVWADQPEGAVVAKYRLGTQPWADIYAPINTGPRQCAAAFTPVSDTTVTLMVLGDLVSGLGVHEGPPRGDFYATAGTPCRVAVQDPSRVLQMLTRQVTAIDFSVTLLEVGRPAV